MVFNFYAKLITQCNTTYILKQLFKEEIVLDI